MKVSRTMHRARWGVLRQAPTLLRNLRPKLEGGFGSGGPSNSVYLGSSQGAAIAMDSL